MPYRIIPFIDGEIYHIYNRGTEKRQTFEDSRDYNRFLKTIRYYQVEGPKPKLSLFLVLSNPQLDQNKKIVQILSYCLMPNHFHLLVRQSKEGGITEFLKKSLNSYTKYYNTKHTRVGPLLQGEFKAVLVETNEQFVHLSRYIHLNPIAALLVKDLKDFKWSSYEEYINNTEGICPKNEILSFFKSPKDYEQFVLDQISYAQDLQKIKHLLLED